MRAARRRLAGKAGGFPGLPEAQVPGFGFAVLRSAIGSRPKQGHGHRVRFGIGHSDVHEVVERVGGHWVPQLFAAVYRRPSALLPSWNFFFFENAAAFFAALSAPLLRARSLAAPTSLPRTDLERERSFPRTDFCRTRALCAGARAFRA